MITLLLLSSFVDAKHSKYKSHKYPKQGMFARKLAEADAARHAAAAKIRAEASAANAERHKAADSMRAGAHKKWQAFNKKRHAVADAWRDE